MTSSPAAEPLEYLLRRVPLLAVTPAVLPQPPMMSVNPPGFGRFAGAVRR